VRILLLNTNLMRPRVAPIGLDYVASALAAAGAEARLFDLALAGRDWQTRLKKLLDDFAPHLIGITIRNIDDCYFLSGRFLLAPVKKLIRWLRKNTKARIVLGGVGFSIAPSACLDFLAADYGIWGDGEESLVLLLKSVSSRREPKAGEIPGLVLPGAKVLERAESDPDRLALNRKLVDNSLYFRLGGQVGIETKRGCSGNCIYCADPLAKGTRVRLRNPAAVADEIEELLGQGAWAFHICDSEFNRPRAHAQAVLEEIVRRGLGRKIALYGYFSPMPFDQELARLYARAGGKGICFGADSGSERMLATLKRDHSLKDLETAVAASKKARLKIMYDLLLGGPGESLKTLAETIALMQKLKPDRVGISWGIRVYAGTELAKIAGCQNNRKNPGLLFPVFYLAPALKKTGLEFLRQLIGNDNRFFLPAKISRKQNYNYSGNLFLEQLIKRGARGAYWKILYDHAEKD